MSMSKDHIEHTPIDCEEVIAHLFAYLDNETDPEKCTDIERHLEECRACFSRAEFEKALRAKVNQLGDKEAPAMLRQRVAALLKQF
jgi:mycothiol system anti-sigma-R factor